VKAVFTQQAQLPHWQHNCHKYLQNQQQQLPQIPIETHASYSPIKRNVENKSEKLDLLHMSIKNVLTIFNNFNYEYNLNFILISDPLNRELMQSISLHIKYASKWLSKAKTCCINKEIVNENVTV
jgi:hypothetical protein